MKQQTFSYRAKLKHVEKRKDTPLQQQGFPHGGVIAAFADVSRSYAALTTMPENCRVLPVEIKVNMMRPAAAKNTSHRRSVKIRKNTGSCRTDRYRHGKQNTGKMLSAMYATYASSEKGAIRELTPYKRLDNVRV
ncbi:MAG: PaaI family thioesterase [Acidaminococcales bacterium]|nr:PaaI family thioesterase [Acidaminococcales bacterium]